MSAPVPPDDAGATEGLRTRQKARRRQEILDSAEQLFESVGVDAATVAAIAERANVSPPTVFNYFGSKENILSALIFEGTESKRIAHMNQPRRTGVPFAEVMHAFLRELTANTLQIAGKRVWRYAEATHIRRPETEFGRRFAQSDAELVALIDAFLNDYAIVLRGGTTEDAALVGRMFFDRWTARYFAFIRDDKMTMDTHVADLRADVNRMVTLLFDDAFAARSPLKNKEAAE